jgi:hypothetical protein
MSTPSGKPFDPFDLSPYAPKRARERSTFDDSSPENDGNINNNTGDDQKSDDGAAVSLPYLPHAAPLPPAAAEHPVAADVGKQAQSRPRPDPSAGPLADGPAAAATAGDPDLTRLESSLQWLQREEAAARLPRAIQLPPVSGLRPVGPEDPRARAEQFINGVRVPPSLAPERLRPPPPMRQRNDSLRGPLRVLLASAIAAPIAYYFAVGNPAPFLTEPAGEPALASFASRLVASADFPTSKNTLRPGEVEAYNTVVASRNKLVSLPVASGESTIAAQSATSVRSETPAAVAPSAAPDQVAPARTPVRELDADSIKLLMQQGEQFVASGDLVAARLVYQRAAEAGNAAAALALGATFDPAVLAKIGVSGMGADVEKARNWYEKAKEFGSPEAPRRLEMLANR